MANRLMRLERVLKALTMIFLIVAAASLIWRPSAPSTQIRPAGLDASPGKRSPAGVDPGAGQLIIDGNIFSTSRTPPAVRYNPFEPDWGNTDVEVATAPTADSVATTDSGNGVPQLFGTIVGARGVAALMRLDPASEAAQLYREGDRAGGYRVVKINEQSVVLSGPQGRIVLRLVRPEGSNP